MNKTSFLALFLLVTLLCGMQLESSAGDPIQLELISGEYGVDSPACHGLEKLLQELVAQNATLPHSSNAPKRSTDYYLIAGLSSEENQISQFLCKTLETLTLPSIHTSITEPELLDEKPCVRETY